MKIASADGMAFGGAGHDRLAELRTDETALRALVADPGSRHLVLWKGNLLLEAPGAPARLPPDHPILAEEGAVGPVLLGRGADGVAVFARDISGWTPDGPVPPEAGPGRVGGELPRHPALSPDQHFGDLRGVMAGLSAEEGEMAATARAILSWHATHRFCSRCGHPSAVIEAGWQRRCPECGGRHFPRTDPVVIMLITRGDDVLLGRSHGWPEGMYSLPAGFVEPGETIEAAVRREVLEETAIRVGEVGYVCSQPWPFPNSLMFGCRGVALSHEIGVDPVELEDALWLPREELGHVFAGCHPVIRAPRRGAIAEVIMRKWLADDLD